MTMIDSRAALDIEATVTALAPAIRAAGPEIERERRLPPALVRTMAEAGLFRLFLPRALGGPEAEPATLVRLIEAVSAIDASTGWCLANGGFYSVFAGYLAEGAARTIFTTDPHSISAGGLAPSGRAQVVDGGYRVSGRWTTGSGISHATWVVGGAMLFDGDQPRLAPNGMPVTRQVYFPARDCEIIDTWDAAGLRGTASHDYAVRDLFVPAEYTFSFREPPVQPGPLYHFPAIGLGSQGIAVVALGIARHAIDALVELAGVKIPSGSRALLRERSVTQLDVGRAEGLLRSARAFLYETLNDVWTTLTEGKPLSQTQRVLLRLAAAQAGEHALQVADLMFRAGGAAAVYARSPLQQCLRDAHTAAQHLVLQGVNVEQAGQAFLGLDVSASPLLAVDDRSGAAPSR